MVGLFTSPGPIVVEWGPFSIRWYGVLIASAVLIGVALAQKVAKRQQVDPEKISDLTFWLLIGAIPGARAYYVLFQWQDYAHNLGDIWAIWKGGIAIHGAILGGLVAAFLFARRHRLEFWRLADVVAPSLILGQAIGRWGNFFNSEAFGAPTELPWKLFIPLDRRPIGKEAISFYHPTFLYESLWNLMGFSVLMGLFLWSLKSNRPLKTGTLFLTYLAVYSSGRVWIEALRTDSLMLGPLKMAQVVSLIQIAIAIAGLVWLYGLRRRLPDVVAQPSEISSSEHS